DQRTLRGERMVRWHELLGGFRIVNDLADLRANELGSCVVRTPIDGDVLEQSVKELEAARSPARLVDGPSLLRADLQRGSIDGVHGEAAHRPACLLAHLVVATFDLL